MAITLRNIKFPIGKPKEGTDEQPIDLFQFDQSLLVNNDTAQQAHRRGLLTAKSSALGQSQLLTRAGLILLACILAVSFLHIFHTLASYVPSDITPVDPPDWIWHASAALLTLIIDAIALYIVLVGNVSALAGHHQKNQLLWFFYGLTGLLNGVFFVSYVPGAPTWIVEGLDAGFATTIIILMTLLVPISIIAVKNTMQIAETARLKLTVECETLRGLVGETSPTTEQAQAAPTTATVTKTEAPQRAQSSNTQKAPRLTTTPNDRAAARPEPKHVPSKPVTPAPVPNEATRDLTYLTPSQLLAMPGSPEVEEEIKRRVGQNTDRALRWIGDKLTTSTPADEPVMVNQAPNAFEPSPMPETAVDDAHNTDNAPSEALHSSTLGISGISEAPATKPVVDRVCPKCSTPLSAAQYGAAKRWGHCKTCKEA